MEMSQEVLEDVIRSSPREDLRELIRMLGSLAGDSGSRNIGSWMSRWSELNGSQKAVLQVLSAKAIEAFEDRMQFLASFDGGGNEELVKVVKIFVEAHVRHCQDPSCPVTILHKHEELFDQFLQISAEIKRSAFSRLHDVVMRELKVEGKEFVEDEDDDVDDVIMDVSEEVSRTGRGGILLGSEGGRVYFQNKPEEEC